MIRTQPAAGPCRFESLFTLGVLAFPTGTRLHAGLLIRRPRGSRRQRAYEVTQPARSSSGAVPSSSVGRRTPAAPSRGAVLHVISAGNRRRGTEATRAAVGVRYEGRAASPSDLAGCTSQLARLPPRSPSAPRTGAAHSRLQSSSPFYSQLEPDSSRPDNLSAGLACDKLADVRPGLAGYRPAGACTGSSGSLAPAFGMR